MTGERERRRVVDRILNCLVASERVDREFLRHSQTARMSDLRYGVYTVLRAAGWYYSQIGPAFDLTEGAVWRAVKRGERRHDPDIIAAVEAARRAVEAAMAPIAGEAA